MNRTVPNSAVEFPLACIPDAIAAEERSGHFRLVGRLFAEAVRERRELAAGRAYRFDAEEFADLARWVGNERRCCPFLTFALEITANGGAIWLRLTGPAGTHALLDAELPGPPAVEQAGEVSAGHVA